MFEKVARLVLGLFFVGTGSFKVVGSVAPHVPPGVAGFAEFLQAAGVPFPMLGAIGAIVVEILGGATLAASALVARQWMRRASIVASAALAGDMIVALITVGVPVARGVPVIVRGAPAVSEPWRLALEGVLLVAMTVLALTDVRRELKRGAK